MSELETPPPLFGDDDLFEPRQLGADAVDRHDEALARLADESVMGGGGGSSAAARIPEASAPTVTDSLIPGDSDVSFGDPVEEGREPDPRDDDQVWFGSKWLEGYVVPIETLALHGGEPSAGDLDAAVRGLRELGQANPVLVADDGVTVVYRDWLVWAADRLGWKGIAVRSEKAELAEQEQELAQTSLLQEAEMTGVAIDGFEREEAEVDADALNEKSMAERPDWVGLPEFVPATDAEKLVISCKTKADRDAALDALGIRTIHKGTRGTLSVWFPDKERRDLSSLRFVDLFKEEKTA